MKKYRLLLLWLVVLISTFTIPYIGTSAAGNVFRTGSQAELALAKTISLNYLAQRIGEYGIGSIDDLKVELVDIDELLMAHTRVQQTFQGIPVYGGEAIVHFNRDTSFFAFTDTLVKGVQLNTQPNITSDQAIQIAVKHYRCPSCLTAPPKTELFILPFQNNLYLAYRVQLERLDNTDASTMPIYFIDAHTGIKLWLFEGLELQAANGTGSSLLFPGTTYPLNTFFKSGSGYTLEDHTTSKTITLNGYDPIIGYVADDNNIFGDAPGENKVFVDAHYAARKFYDYFLSVHNRNGINGSGGPGYFTSIDGVTKLDGSVVGCTSNYAFWTGNYACLGSAGGENQAWVSLDITGHELTHGVVQYTAGLYIVNEPGAINESMADIFGNMIERNVRGESASNWKVGEDFINKSFNPNNAIRYLDFPHTITGTNFTADDDPDYYTERYITCICPEPPVPNNPCTCPDNGAVHINNGIPNNVFYHLAKGGSNHIGGAMIPSTGLTADVAAKIFYKALKTYMTSNTNFCGARIATISAVQVLYPGDTTKLNAVKKAWEISGLTVSLCGQ